MKRLLSAILICGFFNIQGVFSQTPTELPDSVNTARGVVVQDDGDDDRVVIPPLFEYVVAPDDLPDLQSRTDYLMDNFWNPFDFKNTKIVDQNALNHAFGVYVDAMVFASEKKVKDSVKNLIGKIKGNPGLSFQFAKAAEEKFYGPRAYFWLDDIYMDFLQNLLDNKKIDAGKKKKYAEQMAMLKRCAVGAPLPDFTVVDKEGNASRLNPSKEFTLIELTTPSCEDCRYSNLKLDISGVANDLIEDGRLEVDLVVLGDRKPEGNFPDKWTVYNSRDASDVFDIRLYPCFYIVDKDKKIAGKNLSIDAALDLLETLSSNK